MTIMDRDSINPNILGGLQACPKCGAMNPVGMQCMHPYNVPSIPPVRSKKKQKMINGFFEDEKAKQKEFKKRSEERQSKYHREILPEVWVDVYDVIAAFEVMDGGLQHALKKILATGKRGHKTEAEDRKDILLSVQRSNEIYNRRNKNEEV